MACQHIDEDGQPIGELKFWRDRAADRALEIEVWKHECARLCEVILEYEDSDGGGCDD